MSQLLQPGWCEEKKEEPKRCFRFEEDARQRSRLRGARKSASGRMLDKVLASITEDDEL